MKMIKNVKFKMQNVKIGATAWPVIKVAPAKGGSASGGKRHNIFDIWYLIFDFGMVVS